MHAEFKAKVDADFKKNKSNDGVLVWNEPFLIETKNHDKVILFMKCVIIFLISPVIFVLLC